MIELESVLQSRALFPDPLLEHRRREAAVDWQHRAGHEITGWAAEEERRAGQVVWSTPALHGSAIEDRIVEARPCTPGPISQVRRNPAGQDAVDLDVVGGPGGS